MAQSAGTASHAAPEETLDRRGGAEKGEEVGQASARRVGLRRGTAACVSERDWALGRARGCGGVHLAGAEPAVREDAEPAAGGADEAHGGGGAEEERRVEVLLPLQPPPVRLAQQRHGGEDADGAVGKEVAEAVVQRSERGELLCEA